MIRRSKETAHTGRNLAVAAVGLGVAAAGAAVRMGYKRALNQQAMQPDLVLNWSSQPVTPPVEKTTADFSTYANGNSRRWRPRVPSLAILSVDSSEMAAEPRHGESAPSGDRHNAVAVRGQDGSWRVGTALPGEKFGEGMGKLRDHQVIAVDLGAAASMGEIMMGVQDTQGNFTPLDTEFVTAYGARDIKRDYPDVPVLALPSPDLFAAIAE